MTYSEKTLNQLNDIVQNCTECKRCMGDCLFLQAYCPDPKVLCQQILDTDPAQLDPKLPYSCLLCGHCTFVCPQHLALNEAFLSVRQDLMQQQKLPLKSLKSVLFHQKFSTSRLFTTVHKESKS